MKKKKQIKELGDFLAKIEGKLNLVHKKMKEDSNILGNQLSLNPDLLNEN